MSDDQTAIAGIFARCAVGEIPPNVALMQLMIACGSAEDALMRIDEAIVLRNCKGLREMRRLAESHEKAWGTIHAILADVSHDRTAPTAQDWAGDFDRAAAVSPEAGVALYSLGSADLLAEASAEIVGLLRSWQLLGRHRRVLDLGCGIGRLLPDLARQSAFVLGADISAGMLALARGRCAMLPNSGLLRFGGEDLAPIADRSIDLLLAVDSFPYIERMGTGVVRRFFSEMARCLAPGGDLVIFNFSYRGDLARDRGDVLALATQNSLAIRRNGTSDLGTWDGMIFHLSKPSRAGNGAVCTAL